MIKYPLEDFIEVVFEAAQEYPSMECEYHLIKHLYLKGVCFFDPSDRVIQGKPHSEDEVYVEIPQYASITRQQIEKLCGLLNNSRKYSLNEIKDLFKGDIE